MRLDNGKVTFEMKEHFATKKEAQEAVEGYLKAWQIYTNMRLNYNEVRFEFEKADVIDRNPTPGVFSVSSCVHSHSATGSVTLRETRKEYPAPPERFWADPDVDSMWHRYEGYLGGREPLAAMAYFCLTVLEVAAGAKGRHDRYKLTDKYRITEDIFQKLGDLSSDVGDIATGRKAKVKHKRPHTQAEIRWIKAVIKAIILRAGELAVKPTADLKRITMADFPKL